MHMHALCFLDAPHERQRVAQVVPMDWAGTGDDSLDVYTTEWVGRGVVPPISTRNVCDGGSVSNCVTASLAAASARSLPRILVWALMLWRDLRKPADRLVSIRSVMLPIKSLWWLHCFASMVPGLVW